MRCLEFVGEDAFADVAAGGRVCCARVRAPGKSPLPQEDAALEAEASTCSWTTRARIVAAPTGRITAPSDGVMLVLTASAAVHEAGLILGLGTELRSD